MINIVIPVHNRREFTKECLVSLAAQTYRDFRIVVVDDGSTDGTDIMIKEEFPEVVVLRGDGNLWWTEATNWGVRYAQKHQDWRAENFVLTLNNDTLVRPDYLQTMLDAYEQHKPCLIGSTCVDSEQPDRLEYAGTAFELYTAGGRRMAGDYHYSYPELLRRATFVESQSLPGRGTLIPMAVFEKIGLYDSKHYIHYLSDIEFSMRARKAGYRLIVNVSSLVYEYVNSTSSLITHQAGWKEFWDGFTSIKSPTNLKIRYRFAITHSRTKLIYFICDMSRICAGFLLRKIGLVKTA